MSSSSVQVVMCFISVGQAFPYNRTPVMLLHARYFFPDIATWPWTPKR